MIPVVSPDELISQMDALLDSCPLALPALSNAASLIFHALADLNWCGFYLLHQSRLVLGPFQGRPACILIERGRGVCGHALAEDRTLRVPDVHAFPGHIACDAASRSELVIPLRGKDGQIRGVLDLDSPRPDRFSQDDQQLLESFCALLARRVSWDEPIL